MGTTETDESGHVAPHAAMAALGELYHRYLTGLLLSLVSRAGTARATEVAFRTFRRQHLEKFLPGLAKLGLTELPPAVACAQYHVLSNALGGVGVEWVPESERKSWVRYLPPRWIFDGTAVCGIPTEVSRAMMWGWHAHNGVTLGNPNLGFVCTMMTTDGQPGLEGYYIEEDGPLLPDERLRFRPGERPPGPAIPLPVPDWGPERLAKVERNYATEYIRSIIPEMCAVLGPADAGAIGRVAGRQIGMQYAQAIATQVGVELGDFGQLFTSLLAASGDTVSLDGESVTCSTWRVLAGIPLPPEAFEAWNGLWEGLAAMAGVRLEVTSRLDLGDDAFRWRLIPLPPRRLGPTT